MASVITVYYNFTGGDHTRTRAVVTSRVGALAAFTKKRETCLGCKAVLPVSEGSAALCSHCKPNEVPLYINQMAKYRELETNFSRLWTQCQTCQCSLHEEVICTRYESSSSQQKKNTY